MPGFSVPWSTYYLLVATVVIVYLPDPTAAVNCYRCRTQLSPQFQSTINATFDVTSIPQSGVCAINPVLQACDAGCVQMQQKSRGQYFVLRACDTDVLPRVFTSFRDNTTGKFQPKCVNTPKGLTDTDPGLSTEVKICFCARDACNGVGWSEMTTLPAPSTTVATPPKRVENAKPVGQKTTTIQQDAANKDVAPKTAAPKTAAVSQTTTQSTTTLPPTTTLPTADTVACSGDYSQNMKSCREQRVVRRLLENYSDMIRPPPDGSGRTATLINVTITVLSLSNFNDVNMQFEAQIKFQQEWFDPRLKFQRENYHEWVNIGLNRKIWVPDTFFHNELEGHNHEIDTSNYAIQIRHDGAIRYHKRLTMLFSCPMTLQLFPHDNQTCVIEFGSYAYTTNDIRYEWSSALLTPAAENNPKFKLSKCSLSKCEQKTSTGTYGCLSMELRLQREFSFFFMTLYFPSCMLVSVSFVSFWIDWRSAPSRVPLTIVTLLTVTTQAQGINATLPPVSYTKAIDLWIGACTIFVFGSLLEFAVVNYIGTQDELLLMAKQNALLHVPMRQLQPYQRPSEEQQQAVAARMYPSEAPYEMKVLPVKAIQPSNTVNVPQLKLFKDPVDLMGDGDGNRNHLRPPMIMENRLALRADDSRRRRSRQLMADYGESGASEVLKPLLSSASTDRSRQPAQPPPPPYPYTSHRYPPSTTISPRTTASDTSTLTAGSASGYLYQQQQQQQQQRPTVARWRPDQYRQGGSTGASSPALSLGGTMRRRPVATCNTTREQNTNTGLMSPRSPNAPPILGSIDESRQQPMPLVSQDGRTSYRSPRSSHRGGSAGYTRTHSHPIRLSEFSACQEQIDLSGDTGRGVHFEQTTAFSHPPRAGHSQSQHNLTGAPPDASFDGGRRVPQLTVTSNYDDPPMGEFPVEGDYLDESMLSNAQTRAQYHSQLNHTGSHIEDPMTFRPQRQPLTASKQPQRRRGFHLFPRCSAGDSRADRIDKICRALFPVGFILFNVAYWISFLRKLTDFDGCQKMYLVDGDNSTDAAWSAIADSLF